MSLMIATIVLQFLQLHALGWHPQVDEQLQPSEPQALLTRVTVSVYWCVSARCPLKR
ncbi:hypothetical protein C8J55DRAFT_520975 [Lentinula edodes]|uniref:Uncharacterized protein n=1 Tax=Lentinula lateritia TaxID=40482 RepID=A0A9W9A306_9AGAR|nr:hypothetical protein C8J55DRAFT_520975 [Lentinula edodes]